MQSRRDWEKCLIVFTQICGIMANLLLMYVPMQKKVGNMFLLGIYCIIIMDLEFYALLTKQTQIGSTLFQIPLLMTIL